MIKYKWQDTGAVWKVTNTESGKVTYICPKVWKQNLFEEIKRRIG